MKSINDIEVLGTIGTVPLHSNTRGQGRGRPEMQLTFPLVWTLADGESHVITATAISDTAHNIQKHIQPGEPLLVTGTLDDRVEGVRLRVRSMQRLVTLSRTLHVPGKSGPLLSLEGGRNHVLLRGHAPEDSVTVPGREDLYAFRLKHEGFSERLNRTITHFLPVLGPLPVRAGQAISVRGSYRRSLLQDEREGHVLAEDMIIGERATAPANLSIRDPRDRLQLDRLREQV